MTWDVRLADGTLPTLDELTARVASSGSLWRTGAGEWTGPPQVHLVVYGVDAEDADDAVRQVAEATGLPTDALTAEASS